jgi:WD40 repeat protein
MAQRLDPTSGKLSGEPVVVASHVRYDAIIWRTVFSASDNGVLVYLGGSAAAETRLTWYDRKGKSLGQVGNQTSYQDPRISPDGHRVAVAAGDPGSEIWVYDLQRNVSTRLTFNADGAYVAPAWSPDGKKIAYCSGMGRNGRASSPIYVRNSDGTGETIKLAEENRGGADYPEWSIDGSTIFFKRLFSAVGNSIYAVRADGSAKPRLVLAPPTHQANTEFYRVSPDGRWIAYQSNESGRAEIYVAPLAGGSGKWQLSNGGGKWVSWRHDAKEIFFLGPDLKICSIAFDGSGAQPVIGSPQPLFAIDNSVLMGSLFDVSPDGQRILLNAAPPEAPSPIEMVVNWPAKLKK